MTVYEIDPLVDPRWLEFILCHPRASVFHSPQWLGALKETYGYRPVVFTTTGPERSLQNGIIVCEVSSWATGTRLVSLPFSDHCDVLVNDGNTLQQILESLVRRRKECGSRYIELRPLASDDFPACEFVSAQEFVVHSADLRPSVEEIFASFHSSERKQIRKAERVNITYVTGREDRAIKVFYDLILLTRQRHCVPPPPINWYQNLLTSMGKNATIGLIYVGNQAAAALLTLRFKDTLVLKYTGSNRDFRRQGVVPILYWKAMMEAKANGCVECDFGRTELSNQDLIAFKRRWGCKELAIKYWRYPESAAAGSESWRVRVAKSMFSYMPQSLLSASGSFLYKHIG